MKEEFMQALLFPRYHVRMGIDSLHCVHGGNFHEGEQLCEACKYRDECAWLYQNDECSGVVRKSVEQLASSLQYSLDYIDTRIAKLGHHIGECNCDACSWLKATEQLVGQFNKA